MARKDIGYIPRTINDGNSELVDITTIKPHPQNVNEGDKAVIEASIRQNGFWGSLVCQKSTRYILAGNHRAEIAASLGFTDLPVTWVDCSDEDAIRVLLADNRTGRLGKDNPKKLADLLVKISATNTGLLGTGYKQPDLDRIIAKANSLTDEMTAVSESGGGTRAIQYLRFGDKQIPLTKDEYERLTVAAAEHAGKHGNYFGFVTSILDGDV
jgi:hypothetical protein